MAFTLDSKKFNNRFFLGSGLFPSYAIMQESIIAANIEVITVSIRRQLGGKVNENSFWDYIKSLSCHLLPNTAGCFNAKEAIYTAQMAREIFETNWIKLEVIGDNLTLQPDPFELLKACEELLKLNFFVLPYCTEDLILCQRLVNIGCEVLMPWGAPIGSGKGLQNPYALRLLRERFENIALLIDAGIGAPSHAALAMEMGFDGVLLNSAVALANDPIKMAQAFTSAVQAGRQAYEAGLMPRRDFAHASTPLLGKPIIIK